MGRYQASTTSSYGKQNKGPEMKFYPHGSGKKGQLVMHATVNNHIVSHVKRTCRNQQKNDLSPERPNVCLFYFVVEDNLDKAPSLIFGTYCSQAIQT